MTIDNLREYYNRWEDIKVIPFWKEYEKPYGVFSQWYQTNNQIKDGTYDITYSCMEQYMMYHKALLFENYDIAEMILKEQDPSKMKNYGRMVKNFDSKKWDDNKYYIVAHGNTLKFSQNEDLKKILLSTGDHILCEAAYYDKVWGIGLSVKDDYDKVMDPNKWPDDCQNLLGNILMNLRETLKR